MLPAGHAPEAVYAPVCLKKQLFTSLVGTFIAELVAFPLETLKVQQQVHGGHMSQLIMDIFQTQGIKGFFQGLTARMIQTVYERTELMRTIENSLNVDAIYVYSRV